MYPCIISSLCISTPIELGIEVINYWFHRKRELISQRFTNDFIIESIKFFINKLPKYFNESECKLIMELLKRYMDDGLCFGHQLLHDREPYDIETSPLIC